MGTEVWVVNDAQQLAAEAGKLLVKRVNAQRSEPDHFSLALSGGSTPKLLYQWMAQQPDAKNLWSRVDWFWGDERNVPADHVDSNFRMVQEAFLAPVGIAQERIHPIRTDLAHPEQSAANYDRVINERVSAGERTWPRFHLVLLGLGDDAHTASLFPETSALKMTDRSVICNYVPKLQTYRITLSAPVINAARCVVFLVSGDKKTNALRQIWHGPYQPDLYPAQLIRPQSELIWIVDQAAMADLAPPSNARRINFDAT